MWILGLRGLGGKLCLRLGEESFFYGFGQLVNRLLGEVGGGVRDLEALPLNFPFPVCSHALSNALSLHLLPHNRACSFHSYVL